MDGSRIRFIFKEAQIEESAGRRKFSLVIEEKIMEYEKRMLCGSHCPYILPMHFITVDDTVTAYYDFTGFIQLTEHIKRQASVAIPVIENRKAVCGALDALAGILGCVKGMENHLIFPERIEIHPDAIFINPNNGQAALAFFPAKNTENTVQSRVLALIDEMNELYHNPEIGQYLGKLQDFIEKRNPGLSGMIGMLGTMRREAGYIYWNTDNFRKAEEKDPVPDHEKNVRQRTGGGNKRPRAKLLAIQAIFLTGLTAVFLTDAFDIVNLAGLAVIAAALDVWLVRKLK